MIDEWRTGTDFGRKQSWPNQDYILEFTWTDQRKSQKFSMQMFQLILKHSPCVLLTMTHYSVIMTF
jgi:hypothetical protein